MSYISKPYDKISSQPPLFIYVHNSTYRYSKYVQYIWKIYPKSIFFNLSHQTSFFNNCKSSAFFQSDIMKWWNLIKQLFRFGLTVNPFDHKYIRTFSKQRLFSTGIGGAKPGWPLEISWWFGGLDNCQTLERGGVTGGVRGEGSTKGSHEGHHDSPGLFNSK